MTMHRWLPIRTGLIVSFAMVFLPPARPAAGAEQDSARLLPPDTFFCVQVTDATQLGQKLKSHSLWRLSEDPAVQPVVEPARKAIAEKIQERFKKFCTEDMELPEPPARIPWPTGRVVLAMRPGYTTLKVPEYDFENFDWRNAQPGDMPPIKSQRSIRRMVPRFVLIAEMGENADILQSVVRQMLTKASEGRLTRTRQTIRGVEVDVMASEDGSDLPEHPLPMPAAWAFRGQTFIAAADVALMEDVLARMGESDLETLADRAAHRQIQRQLRGPGDLSVFLDLRALLRASVPDTGEGGGEEAARPSAEKMLRALGLENVEGVGAVVQLAPNEAMDLQLRAMLAATGDLTGIPALLAGKSTATEPPLPATAGLSSLLVGSYDLGEIFDGIRAIVSAMSPVDITMVVQRSMEAIAREDPQGGPAPDVRRDLLGQTAPPMAIIGRYDPARKELTASTSLFAVAVRDAVILERTLARIHAVGSGNDPEMRRQMLGTTIYLLPGGAPLSLTMMIGRGGFDPTEEVEKSAFAVTGNWFVMGPESAVAQAVRDTRGGEPAPLRADPRFAHTARHLPARASLWYYSDYRQDVERLWNHLRTAARAAAKEPAPGETGGEDGEDAIEAMPISGADLSSPRRLVQSLRPYCNLAQLPEFAAVQRYFGTMYLYLKSTDEGIYMESGDVKSPDTGAAKAPQ